MQSFAVTVTVHLIKIITCFTLFLFLNYDIYLLEGDMSTLEFYVNGSLVKPVLDAYLHQNGRFSALADQLKIADSWLFNPPDKISMEQYFQLLLSASELVNDSHLGIKVGQYSGLASFDVLGKALENTQKNKATLAKALQQMMLLERLVHRLGDSRVEMEGNHVRVIWRARFQQHKASRLVSESILAGIVHLAQTLADRLIPILDVTFVHHQPTVYSESIYQQAFGAQCRFSQKYNSLLLAADVLAWPLKQSQQTMQTTRNAIEQAQEETTVERVVNQLKSSLVSAPKLSQIAAILGLNERSLQRKLKTEGYSYQQLLAQVRMQQACDYLQYSNLNILNISQLLGFKEQSSFNHFFMQEMGVSPLNYKHRNNKHRNNK